MRFQTEVWDLYSAAQNQAKRTVRKGAARGADTNLPMLKSVLNQDKVAGEVDLGVVNIPVKQIVGIVSDSDRDLYTADFLPIPSVRSEYAQKWTQIYLEHLSDAGLSEPIRCYEYLGAFYVIDGKKRVSVLKAHGEMMVKANVIRILPVQSEDPKIQAYNEFLKTYEKTGLYQISFSQTGKAETFLKALGYEPDHVWNETDRFGFIFHWYPFERALKLAFDGSLTITTADAVLVLLKNHSYAELRDMPSWTLAELMQEAWVDMYKVADPDFQVQGFVHKKAS